ncbi:MAG: TlpA disulfide reductase family protein [Planctomycetota bacterium]|nr:TlpA disulfide reductase family protein [Planctomycetota bacterium]
MMTHSLARRLTLPVLMCLLSIGLMANSASAQKKTLATGDQAPTLALGGAKVVSGPVPKGIAGGFEQGKTYVVEFWATWCPPCRASIPHINKLYKTFKSKGLSVIGVSDESFDVVNKFVARKGAGMSYTVMSDPSGEIQKAYMGAAGLKGIPSAFVVGPSGRIVYIGHPMSPSFDRAIKLCTSGKYDPVLEEKARPLVENLDKATNGRDWRMAHRQIDGLLEIDPWVFSDTIFTKYKIYLIEQEDPETAHAYMARQITEVYTSKPDVLSDILYNLLTDPELAGADPALQDQAIEALSASYGMENPKFLSLLAFKSHKEGNLSEAVELQYKAYMAAEGDQREEMRSVLDAYKAEESRRKGSSRGGRQRR